MPICWLFVAPRVMHIGANAISMPSNAKHVANTHATLQKRNAS